MTQVSVILPTVRPHLLRRALGSIPLAARGVDHEVVVVADFAPYEQYLDWIQQGWVTWIVRSRRGVVDAANVGHRVARGKYSFLFNDESVLDENALTMVYKEAEKDPSRLLSPKHLPEFDFRYYGKEFVPFVFASRLIINRLAVWNRGGEGLLDPVYRGFYADPDLSMRAHENGIPLHVVEGAILRHCNEHDQMHQLAVNEYLLKDRETFRSRWDFLGEFKDP